LALGCSGTDRRAQDAALVDASTDHETATEVGMNGDALRDVIVIGKRDTSETPADVTEPPPDTSIDAALDAEVGSDTDAIGDVDAAEVSVQSICPERIPIITLPSDPVTGVLTGPSRNPIVSCQGGVLTPGPDAFYTLTLTATATIDLHVTAPVETLVSVRAGPCSDSISEIACGQDPALDVLPDTGSTGATGFFNGAGSLSGGLATTDAGGVGVPPPTPPIFDAGFADASSFDGSGGSGGNGTVDSGIADATDADASSLLESDLRVRLAAGTYTIVIDTFTLGPLTQATYTLTVGTVTPAPNSTCATPTLLASGTTATDQTLDLAGASATVCDSSDVSALFYSVGVPPGQRLTASALPTLGDRTWMPVLEAFTSCTSGTCLAQGHASSGTTQQLDWINNGTDWQLVDLAVAADGPVVDATFDLNVFVQDLSATCSRPTPLKDGTALLDQDLSLAPPASANPCNVGGDTQHALYYAATLLPLQSIEVDLVPSTNQKSVPFIIPSLGMITSCDSSSQCSGSGNVADFTNFAQQSTTVLFVVSPQTIGSSTLFDLHVSMPPPPAHIVVAPTSGLVTSQAGASTTFQVRLTSPPTANVSIAMASDTPTQGTASPAMVTFTPSNWSTSQVVTVTGVDDGASAGPQEYTIVTDAAVSTDGRYSGMNPDDVSVTNLDTHPGLLLLGADDIVTSESGRTASFTVQLNSAPTASVRLPLSSSDVTEGTVSPASLIFTSSNWNVPQTVTVTGVDDMIADGVQAYTIVTGTLVSTDSSYNGQNPPDVAAHNLDDDYAPVGVKLISGGHGCSVTNRFPIAIDELNKIYVVMSCEMGLWLTTSSDGGATFSDATMIPNTSNATSSAVELGSGIAGFVYLAYLDGGSASWFLRSTDGGTTWSTPTSLATPTNTLHLAAAKRIVAVLTDAPGGNSTLLWLSVDGGATFSSPASIPDTDLNIGVSADGGTEWLLEVAGNNSLEESTNAAQTLTIVGSVGASLAPVIFGKKSLFGILAGGGALSIDSLTDPTMSETPLTTLQQPLALAVDDADTVTVIDTDPSTTHLRATQASAGSATQVAGPLQIGPGAEAGGIVALSRKAVAVAFNTGSVILFTTATFP
jgi:hypothetical protein